MSNFRFLLSDPEFSSFADVAVAAEKILHIDPAACILNCRRSMEFAVKWMYSIDQDLDMPDSDNLLRLMSQKSFRSIVGPALWQRMDLIRRKGNTAAHDAGNISEAAAMVCLENLHAFLDFVAYCYGENHQETGFDPSLVPLAASVPTAVPSPAPSPDLLKLIEENKKLKAQLTARREEHQQSYVPKPLELSEYETRKFYIDAMLEDAGWTERADWRNEIELPHPTQSGELLTIDYVLYGNNGLPLAIIEAQRTSSDLSVGIPRAQLCAKAVLQQWGYKPVIFLTNGFETLVLDGMSPERKCSCIYSKKDLEKLFRLRKEGTPLDAVTVEKSIADRYYQADAVRALCRSLEQEKQRKALLVMAAGSGKTRTVIALCDVLLRHRRGERILFLTDSNSLLTQAKRSFEEFLPRLSTATVQNLSGHSDAQCIFATYEEMMDAIDSLKDGGEKVFTCGYFDLVIWDNVHPSVYHMYQDVLSYFDAPLIGMTATPRSEIPDSIYELFGREKHNPNYCYEPAQAVRDGYLVDFLTVKTDLSAPTSQTAYEDLSEKEQEKCEQTFADPSREMPDKILSSALNRWIFDHDIIRQVLHIAMEEGIKGADGKLPGKTILFAKNLSHAQKIAAIFAEEYPHLPDFSCVIEGQSKETQRLIDNFSKPNTLPRMAISSDLLDTGIDIPACVNLVFFKRVMSKEKFRQMIGRGSRPCPGLQGGRDKDRFYIFDFCGNFEFFRLNEMNTALERLTTAGVIFCLMLRILQKLQKAPDVYLDLAEYQASLLQKIVTPVQQLNRDNFAVRRRLRLVELYSNPQQYTSLTEEKVKELTEELAPLLPDGEENQNVLAFHALLYAAQLARLIGDGKDRIGAELSKVGRILSSYPIGKDDPAQRQAVEKLLQKNLLKKARVLDLEELRAPLGRAVEGLSLSKPLYNTDLLSIFAPGAK